MLHIDPSTPPRFFTPQIVIGTLKGYDPLLNLVLDETEECLRGMGNDNDADVDKLCQKPLLTQPRSMPLAASSDLDGHLLDQTRTLGLIVCRGPSVILISPMDGTLEIANPFIQEEEAVI